VALDRENLVEVLRQARDLLSRPENDFLWSSWENAQHATREIDRLIAEVAGGGLPGDALQSVFAPSGPLQEVSLGSGWAEEFLTLAARFDDALET
jgi:hypothetical protein